MPHTVSELRVSEEVKHAYVLLLDGLPIALTTDSSGELTGSGASSFIGRAEADAGETVGGREIFDGLETPDQIAMGGTSSSLGLDRTDATFTVILNDTIAPYLVMGGEEPDEMLGRLPPTTDPAPASVVGVTVRDRYIGLEYIGGAGERHMFPVLMGETMAGYDHHGDADGAVVPAAVAQRPLVHEGRLVALYRIFRDPSSTSTSNSDAWPSLSNYRPIWVGKMRDAGTIESSGRISIECTGFESLLERNMATGASQPFEVLPELTPTAGVDDQVAIYFGSGPQYRSDNTIGAAVDYGGRDWTTLSGTSRAELHSSLQTLITDTIAGSGVDYEAAEPDFDTVNDGDAGFSGDALYVQKDTDPDPSGDYYWQEMRIFMHRRRWLTLGFDPEQQDFPGNGLAKSDTKQIAFTKLSGGGSLRPKQGAPLMGAIPGSGYYGGVFETLPVGATSFSNEFASWDNNGAPRYYDPLYPAGDPVRIIKPEGGQVLRMSTDAALLPQSHVPFSGSIDGTSCDAAGYFLIKGRIRKAEGSTDDATLVVEDDAEQVVVARCSWIVRDDYFADVGAGVAPALYIEQLYDPRTFGYPHRKIDRDWASLGLKATQIHTWATGTAAGLPERADQIMSAMLRSTGTSTGPDGLGIIDQGVNSGTAFGFFGDIYAPEMGLGVPDALLPTQAEITDIMAELPNGADGDLARMRPAYEGSFSSYDALRAMLEPRGIRVGFDGGRLSLYRLRDASPFDATVAITESDLHGKQGDPTSVWPQQQARALPPVDAWTFSYAGKTHEQRAMDPNAATRRGDNVRDVEGKGLIAPELYGDDPQSAPAGSGWKNEARVFFGDEEASFLARRHGKLTLKVSRPKGQDIYPGTLVTVSNPWPLANDGARGLTNVVGRVIRASHELRSGACTADILIFEGQDRSPPLYAPYLWIESATNSTTLVRHTSTELDYSGESDQGWIEPAWSTAGGGDALAALWRQLPDGPWVLVGTADVGSVTATHVNLSSALTGMPPDMAYTMILTLGDVDLQPAWAQNIYAGVAIQGDNSNSRRFV